MPHGPVVHYINETVECHSTILGPVEEFNMIHSSLREEDVTDGSLMSLVERRIKFYILLAFQTPALLTTIFM